MRETHNRTYTKKIMVNASVRGPFLPFYSRMCWTDAFLSDLSDKVKMVGTTFNCVTGQNPHLQTMVVALDEVGYELGRPIMGCPQSMEDAIKAECSLTKRIREDNYYVAGIMPSAAGKADYLKDCDHSDINFHDAYFGEERTISERTASVRPPMTSSYSRNDPPPLRFDIHKGKSANG